MRRKNGKRPRRGTRKAANNSTAEMRQGDDRTCPDPALLIFDEATSALDSISEAAIQAAINPLIEARTSILIAHRLSTILAADEILVVRDGRIAERGTHKDLVHAGGTYQELYETQFSKAMES